MKKFLVLAISLIALASCEKDPDMSQLDSDFTVYTDYDSSTDFSNFTTTCFFQTAKVYKIIPKSKRFVKF